MPHPTPYSRQFDEIRLAYPALFERPGSEAQAAAHSEGINATTDSRDGCEQTKPEGK